MASRAYKTYIIAFKQETEADNLCIVLTTLYPSTKLINFKFEYTGTLYFGTQQEFNFTKTVYLYFVAFYLPFNIRLSTLYNKLGKRIWEFLVYFYTANIFKPHEERDADELKKEIIDYIYLTIHNKIHSINIEDEINKETYFKKQREDESPFKKTKW